MIPVAAASRVVGMNVNQRDCHDRPSSCCAGLPFAGGVRRGSQKSYMSEAPEKMAPDRFVPFEATRSFAGTDRPIIRSDGEAPRRYFDMPAYLIDPHTVTNEWFAEFVEETGFVTDAEREGWSAVFIGCLPTEAQPGEALNGTPWWRVTRGASWRQPYGPGSDAEKLSRHPVVHVSWNDALAFCQWAGGRLPTEVEWEHAARGHLVDPLFHWGDREPDDTEFCPCNIWQGKFPFVNRATDGWRATCPVDAFDANGAGLFNMCGNVWEWCHDKGPSGNGAERIAKGGSYLCHASYCYRYRIAARSVIPLDCTTGHVGFRLVFDHV